MRWTKLAPLCLSALLILGAFAKNGEERILELVGTPCNPNNTRLLVDNNQLRTDCGYLAWCDPTDNTCKVRGCRRDEWPFGFNRKVRELWPPKCNAGQFCPDEGSYCMDMVGLGAQCQLSRDDQCVQTASPRGVTCLHSRCVAIDATLGANCTFENTIYASFIDSNDDYGEIISRDNCIAGLYCDSPTTKCMSRLGKGAACSADKECQSDFCADNSYVFSIPVNNNQTGICADALRLDPSKPYVYVLIVLSLVIMAIVSGISLIKLHQKQTKAKKQAREEYWSGQRAISEKARLIDGSIRSSTPLTMANMQSGQRSARSSMGASLSRPVHPSEYLSQSGSFNSLTSLTREITLSAQNQQSSSFHLAHETHPLQQGVNYRSVHQQDGNSVDDEIARPASPSENVFLTPKQSFRAPDGHLAHSLSDSDNVLRSRDAAKGLYSEGWRSPDAHRVDQAWSFEDDRSVKLTEDPFAR